MRVTIVPLVASPPDPVVIVSAYNEAERLPATLDALALAFPRAAVVVADDASTDDTARVARASGVDVVRAPRNLGKGGAATRAARTVLARARETEPPVFVLCDGDLGETAAELGALVATVEAGRADLVVAAFARPVGGGFGLAVGFARWSLRRITGLELAAPISGQRALSAAAFAAVVPFAPRFGMEIGMTVDAARSGFRVAEVELPLAHRATGRTWSGFAHRGRQLGDLAAVSIDRR